MSLRVAGKIAPAIVVTFAKGVTLGRMFRLGRHNFAEQRGSRVKCQQTLSALDQLNDTGKVTLCMALLGMGGQTLISQLCQRDL